ncbi:piggyBac transposable element-derived protein 2-like [Eupeodes corollae]|uniref:piggyBac transposable element-derived protein 2-like n=1 Tax=Eupeodes corollae TaxID=290404 RepID=UPI00248F4A02|nr:piggyBac transposable element-derived protein 2-like [Eupeodes corollae]
MAKHHMSLGFRVIVEFLDKIIHPSNQIVFFDIFLTSRDLLGLVKQKGFRAIGTVRESRTKKCPLKSNEKFKKENREFYDHRYDTANKILLMKWNNNSAVSVGPNFEGIEPMHSVNRWCWKEKAKVNVKGSKMIAKYSSGMAGVDLHNQAINNNRITFRNFTIMINSVIVNAWKLYKMVYNSNIDLLQFQPAIPQPQTAMKMAMAMADTAQHWRRPTDEDDDHDQKVTNYPGRSG